MISLVALTLLSQPAAAVSLEVGKPAPEFALTDLEGNAVKLSDHKGKVVILEWFNPGCPYVVYAHEEGPLKAMAQKYDAREDMVWLAINSGAEGKQGHGLEVNKAAAQAWQMDHPVLLDPSGDVGRAYGAKTTPQMVVIGTDGIVAYLGALDNAPFGKAQGAVVNYVQEALAAVTAGAPVSTPRTKPYGCSVKY